MATPTSAERRFHAAGIKKYTTWGTATALGATDEVLLTGHSNLDVPNIPLIPDLSSDHPFIKQSDLGNIDPLDIAIPFDMRYEMGAIGRAIACLFGTAGTPSDLTGAYQHSFQWADEIEGLFLTYAEERPSKIYESASVKPFKLELNLSEGLLRAVLSCRANTCINTSAVNAATQMDALTLPADFLDTRIRWKQGVVKMNAESGGAVDSETALVLSDLNIVLERPMTDNPHVVGSDTIIEPLEGKASGQEILVTLNFPRMTSINNPFFATYIAGTPQKMSITFTGSIITGVLFYTLAFYFSRLRPLKPNFTLDGGIIKSQLQFYAEQSASPPTGMSYTRPQMVIINKQATDYLA